MKPKFAVARIRLEKESCALESGEKIAAGRAIQGDRSPFGRRMETRRMDELEEAQIHFGVLGYAQQHGSLRVERRPDRVVHGRNLPDRQRSR